MCLRVDLEFYQVKYSALGCKEANATSFIIKKNKLCVRSGFVGPGGPPASSSNKQNKTSEGKQNVGINFHGGTIID